MDPSVSATIPWLSLLIVSLPLGAGLIWLVPDPGKARWVALATALVDLALAVGVVAQFDPSDPGFQMVEQGAWIPTLQVQYLMGVDGITVLFLPSTVLVFLGVILASWTGIRTMPRLYYTLLLLLESATLGIFCALDTILFFLFWELTLIPLYFLISLWGIGPSRRYAAVRYTLFMLAGGVPLLFGFLLLALYQPHAGGLGLPQGLVFDYRALLDAPLPYPLEATVFVLLLLGFAVKTPLLPFHTWLPIVAREGPVAVVALLTGLKLGAYGLIRFVVPLAPNAARELHWLLAGLAVVGILYGAFAALAQTNLRRMLAFASISHVGLVVLGVASFSIEGIQGALFQLLNFTVVASGLFLLTSFLHHRVGSTDVISLGGAARSMPLLATFFLILGLASLGVPGTNGFPAELLLLFSAFGTHTGAGLAGLAGLVLGAAYFLGAYRQAFLGPAHNPVVAEALDLRAREMLVAIVLTAVVLFVGLRPGAVLDLTRTTAEAWVARTAPAPP